MSFEAIKLRELRWALCLALHKWGESGASQESLCAISRDMRLPFTITEIKEVMRYLEDLGFVTLESLPTGSLWAKRTAKLVDLCNYDIPTPPSIERPEAKWW
jgi:hypothetical protein